MLLPCLYLVELSTFIESKPYVHVLYGTHL